MRDACMAALKLGAIGKLAVAVLPKDLLTRLRPGEGDVVQAVRPWMASG